jgi:DNA-binding IclR family transcriptional regulator
VADNTVDARPADEAGTGGQPTKYVQGSQTLARGLHALQLVAESGDGLTGSEVARALGVHQSIAYRVMQTLTQFRLARRDLDGRYRVGVSVVGLAEAARSGLRSLALPTIKDLSRETRCTTWLFLEEDSDAVALVAVEPSSIAYSNRFMEGSRHPINRGSAGYALLSLRPADPDDPPKVREAREQGYVITHGEIAAGSWGMAAPLRISLMGSHACLNLASQNRDDIERAVPSLLRACETLRDLLEHSS